MTDMSALLKPTVKYKSNIVVPGDIESKFKHNEPTDRGIHHVEQGHTLLCDPSISRYRRFSTHDECALLWALSKVWSDHERGQWLVLGSFTCWEACHIALSGSAVACVDQHYGDSSTNKTINPKKLLARAEENARVCGVDDLLFFHPQDSASFFSEHADDERFVGIYVAYTDSATEMQHIAKRCVDFFDDDENAIVVFDNGTEECTQDAIERLCRDEGFKPRMYLTPHLLTVCYRGNAYTPPEHTHDQSFDWKQWLDELAVPRWLVPKF